MEKDFTLERLHSCQKYDIIVPNDERKVLYGHKDNFGSDFLRIS